MEPVKIPIEDIIDLHTFKPKNVPDLLEDYFSASLSLQTEPHDSALAFG